MWVVEERQPQKHEEGQKQRPPRTEKMQTQEEEPERQEHRGVVFTAMWQLESPFDAQEVRTHSTRGRGGRNQRHADTYDDSSSCRSRSVRRPWHSSARIHHGDGGAKAMSEEGNSTRGRCTGGRNTSCQHTLQCDVGALRACTCMRATMRM